MAERLSSALADHYRIERELGAGGMATVYLAHDIKHDRKVAVKLLRPELAAVIGADRFLAEIRTTAQLQHPHILPLFDSGVADGFLYYVMPLMEGETVRDRLNREKQLPVADAIRIATEVAAALDYAHRRGVIHRDIKPENILLHEGSALVADFGIALAASNAGGGRMTETGMSLGTPHYMSPEQAMGEREITARSDVYALGAVTYEMLLGEPPFTGPTAQSIVAKVMNERPASISMRRERVPAEVEDAVLTALEKLPADRFASAADFAAALKMPAGTTHAQGTASRIAHGKRGPDWRLAALAGAIVGAVLGAIAWTTMRSTGVTGASAEARRQLTFNGRTGHAAISPDGDFIAYLQTRCPHGDYNRCMVSLYVQERASDRPVAVLRDLPELSAPHFTHDALSVVVSARLDSVRSGLFVVPRLGGLPRQVAPAGVFDTHATGDSAIVIADIPGTRRTHALVIDLATGTTADTIPLPDNSFGGIGWSPDGQLLALVEDFTKLVIIRRDGTVADSVIGPFRTTVRWTPDGKGVVLFRALPVKEDDLDYYAINAKGVISKTPEVRIPAIATLLTGEFDIARRSGQMVLATGSANFDIWTFDFEPGAGPAQQRTSGTTWYGQPSLSPDGSQVFYMRGDANGDNLYSLTLPDVEESLTAQKYPGFSSAMTSRDGKRVVFGNAVEQGIRVGVMDLSTRRVEFSIQSEVSGGTQLVLLSSGVAYLMSNEHGVAITGAPGARLRTLVAPDSLQVQKFAVNKSEDSVAVVVRTAGSTKIGVTPVATWEPRWIFTFPSGEKTGSLNWSNDGFIRFLRWAAGDDAPSLVQLQSAGGALTRLRSLPTTCSAGISIAAAATRGACVSFDLRGDIWLMNVPGITR